MKKFFLLLLCSLFIHMGVFAQFSSITPLAHQQIDVGAGTQDKSQSKTFYHQGKQWAVFANSTGTHLWRLDDTSWTHIMRLTTRRGRADCKVVDNVVHVFVFQKNTSQLISIEYQASSNSYQLWGSRPSIVNFSFNGEVPTATIDMDGTGRLWLGHVRGTSVQVQWSDAPYSNWSNPITIASNVRSDDAAAIISLPGKIGVLWSNQVTKRWGFKTHTDGDSPSNWSSDEVPASQSAYNVGHGMADNHMNLKASSDGTLYCAIKTGFNDQDYPLIGLLVRRPNGSWDDLYDVSHIGTTPIVALNEAAGKLRVIYPSKTYGGDILYRESPLSNISIGPQMTLLAGSAYRDPSSSKQNFNSAGVVITTDAEAGVVEGVLLNDNATPPPTVPNAPVLASPANGATGIESSSTLSWNAAAGASTYRVQVATSTTFTSNVYDQNGIVGNSIQVNDLSNGTTYYWRVQASNSVGNSGWSDVWSFSTINNPTPTVPAVPSLVSPSHEATGIALPPTLNWSGSTGADSYRVQVSRSSDFSSLAFDRNGLASTSVQVNDLAHNTVYYWRASAQNSAGTSDWSASWRFTTSASTPPPSTASLVGHWKMDEGSGSVLVDDSGYGNNAVLQNTSKVNWIAGVNGLALDLPGNWYRFAIAPNNASLNMTNEITISAWIKPQVRKGRMILSKVDPDGYQLGTNGNGKIEFWFNSTSNGTAYRLYSNANYPFDGNTWMHVAATFDGQTSKIYINGVEDKAVRYASSLTLISNTSDLVIGALKEDNRWNGALDDVRLYNKALGASEIAALVNSGSAFNSSNVAQKNELVEPVHEHELSVYPNPFSTVAKLSFYMHEAGDYTLELYDSKGVLVKKLKQGQATLGEHNTVEIDGSQLSKGLYMVRLQTAKGSRALRLILQK
ncbi:T9SS type A sorting domain-containing protein [Pontibacter sp. JH31]|uniref:T9SS type A sorting domain-containing protein n=1 Tax=Pontibacter aquaedesilientis TaxID=2766980 RepID=A0ABR7XHI9_9BACT|nr:LamG-like jellyroll fold domain-containing protein [Pontibacter aquaedesilientis]MBD1397730.1 T9SS type A sorting domain-containing protein [Pontibacter aquaedesilientis]